MTYIPLLLSLLIVDLLAAMSPGPNFVVVVQSTIRGSLRQAAGVVAVDSSFQPVLLAAVTRGLLTNLANPKSVVYFGSVFALFMGPATPAWVKTLAVAIVLMNTVLWYGAVAVLFSHYAVQRTYAALAKAINRASGGVMIGFGAQLLVPQD